MTTHTECAMKQEFQNFWSFLEFAIPGIPMVMIVMSRVCSLCYATQQDFSNMRPYLYISVTHISSSEEPSRVPYAI